MGQFESFIGVDFWTALFVLLNTCAIFIVARKFLFLPVHNMIESRQKEIDQMYADAEKAKTDAHELCSEYEAKLSGVRQEADRVIRTATESANAMSTNIVEDARAQAAQIKNRAQNEIEIERRRAFENMKGELSSIALDIASQVIEREVNEKDHEAFINEFIKNVGEAS